MAVKKKTQVSNLKKIIFKLKKNSLLIKFIYFLIAIAEDLKQSMMGLIKNIFYFNTDRTNNEEKVKILAKNGNSNKKVGKNKPPRTISRIIILYGG